MGWPRVVPSLPSGGGYAEDASGNGNAWVPVTYPDAFTAPTAAQVQAAQDLTARMQSDVPWLPYTPFQDAQPSPWVLDDLTGQPLDPDPGSPGYPSGWLLPFGMKFASPGAARFFGYADEAQADKVLARFGRGGRENMTADGMKPGGGKRDYVRVLYERQGDYWRPLASFPYYEASSWVQFRDQDLPGLAAVALAMAGGPLIQAIGNAMVPASLAAQFPALPGLVGSTAIQTTMNGGDLGAALQNVVLSATGAQVGAYAGSASGIKTVGDVTGAVTTAALKGGDLKDAALSSLVQSGVRNMDDLWSNVTEWFGGQPAVADVSASYFDPVYDPPAPNPGAGVSQTWEDASGVVFTGDANQVVMSSGDVGDSFDFGKALSNLTNAAMAAIKINAAYQATQAQPRAGLTSGNTVQTPNANGTVTVRNTQTGAVVGTQRPQVGIPMVLADGRTIINNGDGTFTLIARDGSSQRIPYGNAGVVPFPSANATSMTPLLIGAGIIGAVLLLRR